MLSMDISNRLQKINYSDACFLSGIFTACNHIRLEKQQQ